MTIEEANQLIDKYIELKKKHHKSKKDSNCLKEFKAHEELCIQKFKYLVLMKTNKYKNFNNYEDLVQEGLSAILSALHSFNPNKKANIFWWIHRYTDTRIARCANLHTTIRFPLKYAKKIAPHREAILPILIDNMDGPADSVERNEALSVINKNFESLSAHQKKVVQMLFGMDGENPKSITKVCQQLRMSRPACVKLISQAFSILKRNI